MDKHRRTIGRYLSQNIVNFVYIPTNTGIYINT